MNSSEVINSFGLYDKSFSLILDSFKSFPEIEKVIIYGSRAMGNYKKGSDIDLAIVGKEVNHNTVSKISAELNEELPIPYYVDVLDYNQLSNVSLKKHIDTEGKVIYEK